MKKSVNLYVLAASVATAAAVHGFEATLADPLAWLYPDSNVASVERIGEIDVPANGVIDVNLLLNGLKPGERLVLESSEKGGAWCRMVAVPVSHNTGNRGFLEGTPGENKSVTRRAPFEVYDALEPLADGAVAAPKETEALYFRMDRPPTGAKSLDIRFRVKQGAEAKEMALRVNVYGVSLPPVGKDSFKYTNWMNYEGMAKFHGLEPWSEAHWAMIEKYVRLAARGRQNCAIMFGVFRKLPNGDVGVDAEKFRRLLGIYDRAGIWYIEGPHLANFSNGWGSPTFYTALTTNVTTSVPGALKLSRLARQLQAKIDEYGLRDRWYQHVADEPGGKNVGEYRITAGIVRRYMPGVRTIDAVEEPSFAGALDVWVPKVDAFERHRALYESFRTNFHDRVWCYTCCIPGGKWMNRLLDHELLRPALIPWVSGMYDVDGFLHWGYNWWRDGSDPFKDTIILKRNPPLPAGDTHIVYPGKDGPWSSARLEATRAGMEDADLLAMLRRRDRPGADAIVRRMARGYGDYSTSCKLYRETRRDLLRALCGDAGPGPSWRLRWSDEFDGAQLDTNVWRRIPCGGADWDRHMSPRPDLTVVRDGVITMRGIVNDGHDKDRHPWLTGGIDNRNGPDISLMRQGKVLIRAKFQDHQKGAWPALWMCGAKPDAKGRGYPWTGEIDIVERLNGDPFVYHTVHSGWTLNKKHPNEPRHGGKGAIRKGEWNVYGMEITPTELVWSVNGKDTFRYPRTDCGDPDQFPFSGPFFFLLDMQLGGKWVGKVDMATLPVEMQIDYIRIYEKVP